MPGATSMDGLVKLYKSSAIFIMPSVQSDICTDGLPTVIIEAMAFGVPVIATNHAGIPELVIHNKTGIIVEQSNGDQLAMEIIRLIGDKSLYALISILGRKKIEDEYDIEKNSRELFCLINGVVL